MSPGGVLVNDIVTPLAVSGLLVASPNEFSEPLTGITDDSRRVMKGGLFIAVRGTAQDGHDFIQQARAAGASVIIAEDALRAVGGPAIIVRDGRKAAAIAAAAFYGYPARGMRLVAVTGTNGKTTTVGMLRHLLDGGLDGDADATGAQTDASRAASIGTLGVLLGSVGEPVDGGAGLTTPGPVELQRILRVLADRGVGTVAIEVSSHALAQNRVEGIAFDAAVFTNLTRDHLDFHGTMESYFAAKASLVSLLGANGAAVVNVDDSAWNALPKAPCRVTFGTSANPDVRATAVSYQPRGSHFRLVTAGGSADVALPLVGDFNVINALGAAAAAIALGEKVGTVAERLSTMPQVPGRLDRIGEHPAVLRDYAHTPDALERALTALRPFVPGRMIVVFGAGGDRDPGKRPLMGAIAATHADVIVLTSDNPRTEDPERIMDDIAVALPKGGYERIEDRRQAIARAIALADPENDLVLLAGKGHEDYQVRGKQKLHFDEREIVGELMASRAGATP
ncbi:MAG: UDP-N-acetylmuramoyl-L-alanyl-D-glutamate--2,6-diaminopimelate ligase [Gemmatimonadetes bacterium]|nr:UDP-N-acetylmuramoyl-L-alanyl-D-glutamate--2,6-diaminopimelate ligase [Gemmatimonadota bacterium]